MACWGQLGRWEYLNCSKISWVFRGHSNSYTQNAGTLQKEWPLQKPARPSTVVRDAPSNACPHPYDCWIYSVEILRPASGFRPILCHFFAKTKNPDKMLLLFAGNLLDFCFAGTPRPWFSLPRRKEKPSILQGPHATCIRHPSETYLNQERDTSHGSGHEEPRSPMARCWDCWVV